MSLYPKIYLLLLLEYLSHEVRAQWQSGAYLLEFLIASNLEILNVEDRPTFVVRVRRKVMEITIASSSIGGSMRDWRLSGEESLSNDMIMEYKTQEELIGKHIGNTTL